MNLRERLLKSNLDDPEIVRGLFDLARNDTDVDLARQARSIAAEKAKEHAAKKSGREFMELYWNIMLWLAPHDFDSYMIVLEKNRRPMDRFYQPRRKVLKPIVDALQELADDELDYLFVSQPPRTGKTTIMSMFYTWIMGKWPEISNLYSSYAAYVTKTFYIGILEIITDENTYCWHEIFPNVKLAATDAADLRIDIGRKKKFPTLTCRSIDGALNGGADCQGVLCGDDLHEGIEECINMDRMNKKWSTVLNNLLTRQVGARGKIIMNGTRWSIYDVIGRMIDLLENNPDYANVRYKVINLPALDEETGESNFDYDFGKGMTTEQYRQRRAAMEESGQIADWEAQYMGHPVERNGQLFQPDSLNYYNGTLPDEEPVRRFAYIDPAFGGGDFTACAIAYQYEDGSIFIPDVVYSKEDKFITIPMVVDAFIRNNVGSACFEGTRSTAEYKETVDAKLRDRGYRVNITMKAASTRTRKEERIFDKAPEIREFYFRDSAHRSQEYAAFMRSLHAFTINGKNHLHDDSADALAGICDMIRRGACKAKIIERPF